MSTAIELTSDGSDFYLEVARRVGIGLTVRGIKKADLAKVMGMTPSSLSKRLRGHLVMDLDEIAQIALIVGLDRDWLLTGGGPMLDPEWVPPAGIEPAAFCSQDPQDSEDVDTAAHPLADVLPFQRNQGPKSLGLGTKVPDILELASKNTDPLVKI